MTEDSTVNQTYLTPEGAAKLRAELENLTTVKRQELSRRLREAIQMGDLSENADYIMAKEDQAFLEGRILELESVLRNATIVSTDAGQEAGVAGVGRTVTVQEPGEEPETFTLVGAKEADPAAKRISNESPIGRALLGKRVGDVAKAQTPGGTLVLKILKIE
jgi:transcription elongation factor GreA